jgi:hypothetical protein
VSLLLSDQEYAQAREAFAHGQLTPAAYAFLGRLLVALQASSGLAPSAAVGGRWDADSIEETRQAWLEESLLRGGLQRAFDRGATPRAFSRYLERALRNWLISRSRTAHGRRLLERTRQLMSQENEVFELFVDAPEPARRWWGLRGWSDPPFWQQPEAVLLAQAWALGDFAPLRFGPRATNNDPVLSTPDLLRFLSRLFERVQHLLSVSLIEGVLRNRFELGPRAAESLEMAVEVADPVDVAEEALIREGAEMAIMSLTGRQLVILRDRPGSTLEELATLYNSKRSTVDNEYRRALIIIREAAPTEELFEAVLEKVLEIASWEA